MGADCGDMASAALFCTPRVCTMRNLYPSVFSEVSQACIWYFIQ